MLNNIVAVTHGRLLLTDTQHCLMLIYPHKDHYFVLKEGGPKVF